MKPIEIALALTNFAAAALISLVVRLQISDFSVFSINADLAVLTILAQLTIALAHGLSSPGWHKKHPYLLTVVPMSTGFTLGLLGIIGFAYILVFVGLFFMMSALQVKLAKRIMDRLVRPDVLTMSRVSVRVILFSISILAALTLMFNTGTEEKTAVKEDITNYVSGNIIENATYEVKQPTTPFDEEITLWNLTKQNITAILNQDRGVGEHIVRNEIATLLNIYDYLLKPIMGLAIFGLFELYATLAFLLYKLTVKPMFKLLIGAGVIKIETEQVTREIPSF